MSSEPEGFCPKCAIGRITQAQLALKQAVEALNKAHEKLLPNMPDEAGDVALVRAELEYEIKWMPTRLDQVKEAIKKGAMLDV